MDPDTLTKAAKAFRAEGRHWEMQPVRLMGQPIIARRFDTVPAPGKVRMPSQSTHKDHTFDSIEQRGEAVFRACLQAAIAAAAPPAAAEVAA